MTRALPLAAGLVLVVASGVMQALWTSDTAGAAQLEQAARELRDVPSQVGDWRGRDGALDPQLVKQAEIAGCRLCYFENSLTGARVSMLIICGRPGPVSVHTPDVCFTGAGYQLVGAAERYTLPAKPGVPPATFWTAKFSKAEAAGIIFERVFWGWNAQGPWEAPDSPRLSFGRFGVLYKLYVTRRLAGADDPLETDPAAAFLARLIPTLSPYLDSETAPKAARLPHSKATGSSAIEERP
jgi:hypothetical protein